MNAVDPHATVLPEGCYHCGQTLPEAPPQVQIDGQPQSFCCKGCAAATAWIRDLQLSDYYRLRQAPGGRVDQDTTDLGGWDSAEIQAGHVRSVQQVDGLRLEITLVTDGMRCAACAWLIDRALSHEAGVSEVTANAITGRIRLRWDPERTRLSTVLQRLTALGYRPGLARGSEREDNRRAESRRAVQRLGVAALGTVQAMMFAEALYLDSHGQMPIPTRDFLRWVTFLIATPVVFYAGWPFLAGAWRELRLRHPGMDLLVATGVLLAWGGSLIETLRAGAQVWFDAAVMFVFLLLVARQLEQRARAQASARIDALAQATPALATRERADGGTERIASVQLQLGNVVQVAAGEALPADGELLDGAAELSEALLTGESQPVLHQAGDMLHAGSLSPSQALRLRVTRLGQATRLSTLLRLVEQAQAQRPRLARLADRVASRFVISLLALAVLVWAAWMVYAPARAFAVLLSFLVISCPCALALAVPAALAAAHGQLSRWGVLATGSDALENLARATDLVFDKTGTLTTGVLTLDAVQVQANGCGTTIDRASCLAWAASLAAGSRHPVARAFAGQTSSGPVQALHETAGQGLQGQVQGRWLRLGTAPYAAARRDDGGLWLGDGTEALARFELGETLRPEAPAVMAALRQQGLQLHVYSGDAASAVQRQAELLGITDVAARQSPEDKLQRLRALQQQGRVVIMVGDGINDAPVLAGADVSVVVAGSAPLAQQVADVVLTQTSLLHVADAIRLARRTRQVMHQNLAWAVGYNLLALPLAAAGLVKPWMAALAMVVSSLTVTLNALRLTRP